MTDAGWGFCGIMAVQVASLVKQFLDRNSAAQDHALIVAKTNSNTVKLDEVKSQTDGVIAKLQTTIDAQTQERKDTAAITEDNRKLALTKKQDGV